MSIHIDFKLISADLLTLLSQSGFMLLITDHNNTIYELWELSVQKFLFLTVVPYILVTVGTLTRILSGELKNFH